MTPNHAMERTRQLPDRSSYFRKILRVAFVLLLTADLLLGEQAPGKASHSTFEFRFEVPVSFKPAGSKRGYLDTPAGRGPYFDRVWENSNDSIIIRRFTPPEISWQASPERMFAGVKNNLFAGRERKPISERDYRVGGCSARSFVFAQSGTNPHFERMDYILTKPDVNIVVYATRTKASLDSPACKQLFRSVSVRQKN